jgi:branched-chain amino acid transport system ATP-binding protein
MGELADAMAGENRSRARGSQLEFRDICVFYGDARVLNKICLSVNLNEIVAVLGSNGAGKTTLLRTLSGFVNPRYGKIIFSSESVEGVEPSEIIRKGIASVPEGGQLFGEMSVADNLLLGAYTLSHRERREILPTRLEMVFNIFPVLKERVNQKAETLSGGEQQMLAIARGLMTGPRLLSLDEPSLGLSPLLLAEIMKLLREISRKTRVSVLLVEQNARAALKVADYAYVLERGEVTLQGDAEEVIGNPAIYSAYLGGKISGGSILGVS